MKRFVLAIMMVVFAGAIFALGRNDGSSKVNSISFDWINGHTQEAGYKWYHVLMDTVYNYELPQTTLTLTNLSEDSVFMTLEATIPDLEGIPAKHYAMAAGESKNWTISSDELFQVMPDFIFITLTTDQRISITASVEEEVTSDVSTPVVNTHPDAHIRVGSDGVLYIERGNERYSLTGGKL